MFRRLLSALAAGLLVFAAAYGAAASLTVNGGVVQAGGDSVGQCDTDGVSVGYDVKYDNTAKAFVVDGVIVRGIDPACLGRVQGFKQEFNLDVVLTDQAGRSIAGGSNSNIGATTTQYVGVTKPGGGKPLAQDVYGVHVAIYRPSRP